MDGLGVNWVDVPEDQGTLTSPGRKVIDDERACVVLLTRGGYCKRSEVVVGLCGLHVTAVNRDGSGRLVVEVESLPADVECPGLRGRRRRPQAGDSAPGRRARVRRFTSSESTALEPADGARAAAIRAVPQVASIRRLSTGPSGAPVA